MTQEKQQERKEKFKELFSRLDDKGQEFIANLLQALANSKTEIQEYLHKLIKRKVECKCLIKIK